MKVFNEAYEVKFTEVGGEMTSITNKKNNIQYLWQGDETYWSGKNPTLFPIVGNTFDTTYQIDGKTYQMKNHGLVRISNLKCIEQNNDSITFEMKSNKETLKAYPFNFTYQVKYTLKNNVVEIVYHITNDGASPMPFTFGLHPGFNVPMLPSETYDDYSIEFDCEEELQQLIYDENRKEKHYYKDVVVKSIPLSRGLFEKYPTLIYKGMSSSYVTLKGPKHSLRVRITGYPLLALWTPTNDAPFVCIEPWYSHADFEESDTSFEEREGMMSLDPTKTFTTSYTIELEN